jgi:hypothetical protein
VHDIFVKVVHMLGCHDCYSNVPDLFA